MFVCIDGWTIGRTSGCCSSICEILHIYFSTQYLIYKFSRPFTQSTRLSQLVAYVISPSFLIITINGLSPLQMDRTVKIWVIRRNAFKEGIRREDKPVFSSGRIHKARVLSVTW